MPQALRAAPTSTQCYLCGKALSSPTSRDHVPPRQLFSDEIRRAHNLNLLTIPVHAVCNRAYQVDEDYFANTLAPFARGSVAGDAFLEEVFGKYAQGKKVGLVHKVIAEFDDRPSGLVLPDGLVVKRFEGERLARVAWKIVRGLYFHHRNEVLPEPTPYSIEIVAPDQSPPYQFIALSNEPFHGAYPGVFDYKFAKFSEFRNMNYWAMLLWDRVILLVAFHDTSCACEYCGELSQE